jgi:dihydroneopterin aldolase / 2-amino-4-hydroxy-6-hydroxymethyldihydropteridine diphosphokinase
MARVFLSLGSNLSNRAEKIQRAINLLNHNHIKISRVSRIYQTEPVGFLLIFGIGLPFGSNQPDFLNCVLQAVTDYEPHQLLLTIMKIEKALGRKRVSGIRNLPRTIDIDILFYDNKIINESMLKIPHPKIQDRAFILIPLCDIAPDFIHPVLNKTIRNLASTIDQKGVSPWQRNQTAQMV